MKADILQSTQTKTIIISNTGTNSNGYLLWKRGTSCTTSPLLSHSSGWTGFRIVLGNCKLLLMIVR